jgi:hypothetical protein
LELWLGEAKLYDSLGAAKTRAIASIQGLWDPDFLAEMKALIGPKVERSVPYAEKLNWLFADETSLDQLIERIVIPVCLAADYAPTKMAEKRDQEYVDKVTTELASLRDYLQARVPINVTIVCIFIPLDCKHKLETEVNRQVRSFL